MNTSETLPDGVWFRNSPHQNDTNRETGFGVYMYEYIQIDCWAWGDAVGPYNNHIWYRGLDVSRPVVNGHANYGYMNAHYVNDGMVADQVYPGIPDCSTPQPPMDPPPGGSVYYSGLGTAGTNEARPYASFIMSENGQDGPDWAAGNCSPAWAGNYPRVASGKTVTTLSGWSLGRLGPIYAVTNATIASGIHYILMFDPGNYDQLNGKTSCDKKIGASNILANWLAKDSANRLVIMAGELTAPNRHRSIQQGYFPEIKRRGLNARVLVCNVENNGVPWSHYDVIKGYAWMIAQPAPSQCPSGFYGWHP